MGATKAKRKPERAASPTIIGPTLLLTRDDLLRELRVSERTLSEMLSRGELHAADVEVGRSPRWSRAKIEAWIADAPNRPIKRVIPTLPSKRAEQPGV